MRRGLVLALAIAACGPPAPAPVAPVAPVAPPPADAAVLAPPAVMDVARPVEAPPDPVGTAAPEAAERCPDSVELKLRIIEVTVAANDFLIRASLAPALPVAAGWSFRFAGRLGDDPAAHLTFVQRTPRVVTLRLTGLAQDQIRVASGVIASPPGCRAPAKVARVTQSAPDSTGGTRITVAVGLDDGIDNTWTAELLLGESDVPQPGGLVTLVRLNKSTLVGIVRLPPAEVARSPRVRLTPPAPELMTE